jgi:hypothetical protein
MELADYHGFQFGKKHHQSTRIRPQKYKTHGLKDQLVSSDQNLGITQLASLALDGTCTVGF